MSRAKAEWFFAGLAVVWVLVVAGGVLYLVYCNRMTGDEDNPFDGVKPDMGESLHQFGRPAEWNATHMPLGDTGFVAAAGPSRYSDKSNQDWDYYSIDIEKPWDNASYVFFQRDFRMRDIPAELVEKDVRDIVTFSEDSRVVTFTLGNRVETYELPHR